MKKIHLFTLLILLGLLSCQHSQKQTIQRALQMTNSSPDSALTILNAVDRHSLPAGEEAFYALAYSISQDKCGVNVADDSLIRIAYNYYTKHPKDSLHRKCMYYMGLYYSNCDSLERAGYCLKKAMHYTQMAKDTATQCLALSRYSWVVRKTNPQLGLKYAEQALKLYRQFGNRTAQNTIYYIILKCECEKLCGNAQQALNFSKEAEKIATNLGDSSVLSDVYQDMGMFAAYAHDEKAVYYALLSCGLSKIRYTTKKLTLAKAYEETGKHDECLRLLDTLKLENASQYYTAYSLRHHAALSKNDNTSALSYADSAYKYIEKMYDAEVRGKTAYFEKLMKEKTNKIRTEKQATFYKTTNAFVAILATIIIASIVFVYKSDKSKARVKLAYEKERLQHTKELYIKDQQMAERLHKEVLRHKEAQITMMRDFLAKKLEIIQKLDLLKTASDTHHIALTNKDWDEIQVFLENVDNQFLSRIKEQFPQLSIKDLQLLMLVRLKLTSKTLANIYGISEKSIKQKLFVFKEKVGIKEKKISLRNFIERF